MNVPELERAALEVLRIARGAAEIVRRIYGTEFAVDYKSASDPVTAADREASKFIVQQIERAFPGIPAISEEAPPPSDWQEAPAAWFIDPLDGTRDFVARNGEFCVMIGLAIDGRAAMGVIVAPLTEEASVGVIGAGSYLLDRSGKRTPLSVSKIDAPVHARVAVSRTRAKGATPFLNAFGTSRTVPMGSVGLKAILLAKGEADLYVQADRAGSRWDACAPEAILLGAGGSVSNARGDAFDYRDPNLENSFGILLSNGLLHARALDSLAQLARNVERS